MPENADFKKAIKLISFVEAMNTYYYSPKEIEYRIPETLKKSKIVKLIKSIRESKCEPLYILRDQDDNPFKYWITPKIHKLLHDIDTNKPRYEKSENIRQILNELLIQNLIDEAFYSSAIEGALTTRKRACELQAGSPPTNRSEQMCLNNYHTMEFILKNLKRPIDEQFIFELHKIVTEKTLDEKDEPFAGTYRNDFVEVKNSSNDKIIYTPPDAVQVPKMMNSLYYWINLDEDPFFLHPVLKASIIHFYTVYVHPFFDGNGRTARALMYYYLLKHGYEFMKYFSISKAITENKKSKYYKAIKDVEDHDSDLTYFLLYSSQMVLNAISTVSKEKDREESIRDWLKKIQNKGIILNSRQQRLFKLNLKSPLFPITIKKYKKIFKVVYETARSDLFDLTDKELLKKEKKGKKYIFCS